MKFGELPVDPLMQAKVDRCNELLARWDAGNLTAAEELERWEIRQLYRAFKKPESPNFFSQEAYACATRAATVRQKKP